MRDQKSAPVCLNFSGATYLTFLTYVTETKTRINVFGTTLCFFWFLCFYVLWWGLGTTTTWLELDEDQLETFICFWSRWLEKKKTQWCLAYKRWTAVLNCGHWLGGILACDSTIIPSTSDKNKHDVNMLRSLWHEQMWTNQRIAETLSANIYSRRLRWCSTIFS